MISVTFATVIATDWSVSIASLLLFRWSITVLNKNTPQMSLVCETRKATVETILKKLEYVTKGHIAMQTIWL